MKVAECMTSDVELVTPEQPISEAAQFMRRADTGVLPVGEGDRLLGLFPDRDITVRAVAEGKDPRTTKVRDVMTPGINYVFEDDDVANAARQMKEKQIRRLVVLNRDKRLVGIVSLGDVAVDASDRLSGSTLEDVSEPSRPRR